MANDEVIQAVVISSVNADVPVLEEALAALELAPSSYASLETGKANTFLVEENEAAARQRASQVEEYLASWKELFSAPIEIDVQEMRREDWANSWKKNFHTFRASDRLVVKPGWEEYEAKPGEIVLPIDPGMCFGTGYHGTTRACLYFLDKLQAKHGTMSFIDAGTGSGILSIGAALLGYKPIQAFDNDPQCITTSLENMERAGISGIPVTCAPLGGFVPDKPADVVAANILAVVLIQQKEAVLSLARPGGYVILSGILAANYNEILEAFQPLGCVELERVTNEEWTSGLFRRP